jgi:hypothetical protein
MVVSGLSSLSGFRELYLALKKKTKNFYSNFNHPKPLKPLTIGGLPHTPLVFATELPVLALALLLTPNTDV